MSCHALRDPRLVRVVLLLAACLAVVGGCKGASGKEGGKGSASAKAGKGGGPKFPVEVYAVEARRTEYTVTAPGTLDAFERVQMTARVAGIVDKVDFVEGQRVAKEDVLVVIDSERFNSAVNAARATLDKSIATQKEAQAMISRRQGASDKFPGLVPGEELAIYKTKEVTARAEVALASALLRTAQLNLRDASVRAPIDGVIQTRTVETGQYVPTGHLMATLLRRDPLQLRFQVAPLDAPRVTPGMVATFKLRETSIEFKARVTLVAGAADEETRMVDITAEVIAPAAQPADPSRPEQPGDQADWLRPGSFCDVTLAIGGVRDVVTIPRAAVRPTERGFASYVVEKEGVAHERLLKLGANTRDGWVEVREGLVAGDRLVIVGAEPLSEGSKVDIKDVPAPSSKSYLPARNAEPAAPSAPSGEPPPSNASAAPSTAGSGPDGGAPKALGRRP